MTDESLIWLFAEFAFDFFVDSGSAWSHGLFFFFLSMCECVRACACTRTYVNHIYCFPRRNKNSCLWELIQAEKLNNCIDYGWHNDVH